MKFFTWHTFGALGAFLFGLIFAAVLPALGIEFGKDFQFMGVNHLQLCGIIGIMLSGLMLTSKASSLAGKQAIPGWLAFTLLMASAAAIGVAICMLSSSRHLIEYMRFGSSQAFILQGTFLLLLVLGLLGVVISWMLLRSVLHRERQAIILACIDRW